MILHSDGIVHGDLKLENILLNDQLSSRLCDFGMSRLGSRSSTLQASSLRLTHTMKGTVCYMAPELFVTNEAGMVADVSRKTDIYALSILIWEVLSGRRAFSDLKSAHEIQFRVETDHLRPSLDALVAVSADEVSPVEGFPEIRDLLERGWHQDRRLRPSALEFYSLFNFLHQASIGRFFDIFMSHTWGEKKFLCHIYKILQMNGFRVWYDQKDMALNTRVAMQEGIERSSMVLVCLSQSYQSRGNCLFELRYALRAGKPLLVLFVDPDPRPFPLSWLNEEVSVLFGDRYLRHQLWFNVGGDLAKVENWDSIEGESEDSFSLRLAEKEKALGSKLCELGGVIDRLNEIRTSPPPCEPRPDISLETNQEKLKREEREEIIRREKIVFNVTVHPHPLTKSGMNGRSCDGRSHSGGCRSGCFTSMPDDSLRFQCVECDYDLCFECAIAWDKDSEGLSNHQKHVVYEGDLRNGKKHSKGKSTWSNGNVYIGDYRDDSFEGQGTWRGVNGDVFEGEWKDDKMNGQGVMRYNNGNVYEGEWKDSKRNGQGVMRYKSGTVYEGEWKNSKRDGQGVLRFLDGSVYEGEWKGDQTNGQGVMRYQSGALYEGEWKDSKRDGQGMMRYDDGGVYEGEWKGDQRNGQGVMRFKSGDVYEGEWKDDKRIGQGVMRYKSGDVFEGEWKDDKRTGQGVLRFLDGSVFEGEWKGDQRNGRGSLRLSNGRVTERNWQDDIPIAHKSSFLNIFKRK